MSRVLDAGQDLGYWMSETTKDSGKLGLCVKGLTVWDAASQLESWRSWRKCDLGSGGSTVCQDWVRARTMAASLIKVIIFIAGYSNST